MHSRLRQHEREVHAGINQINPESREKMYHEMSTTMDLTPIGKETESVFEGVETDMTLDLRGLSCPLPPLKTVKALKVMKSGEVLEVLGTSPVGKRSAPWLAQRMGNELLALVEDQAGFYRFYLRKK